MGDIVEMLEGCERQVLRPPLLSISLSRAQTHVCAIQCDGSGTAQVWLGESM